LAFGTIGAGLIWAIVTHSLVAALVEIAPSYALALAPDDPAALLAMAERTSQAARSEMSSPASSSSGDDEARRRRNADLRDWASTALAQEPGNARALSILGGLAHEEGDRESAATLMRAGARRSLRTFDPHAWLISDAIARQDWPLVVQQVDALMRLHPWSMEPLTPLLAQMAEKPDAAASVYDAIARAPPWRTPFFMNSLTSFTDARTPLSLLLALKGATAPTISERRAYLDFLIERKFYDLAYYTWLHFLPPDQLAAVGPLFNGSFEVRPSGLPFDWVLPGGGAAIVAIARRPDRPADSALVIEFGQGRVEPGRVSQVVRLQPGRHRVAGEVMGEVVGRRGMRWRLACLEVPDRLIGESDMFVGQFKAWTAFSFDVVVPETDCRAQGLRLELDARTSSERLVSGTIWFDEMSIRREP